MPAATKPLGLPIRIVEGVTRKTGEYDVIEQGPASQRRGYRTRTVKKPGVSLAILFDSIANTVFIRLADVAENLPEYREEARLIGMDQDGRDGPSQATAYRNLSADLHAAVMAALARSGRPPRPRRRGYANSPSPASADGA